MNLYTANSFGQWTKKRTRDRYHKKFRVAWSNMMARCYDPKTNGYERYGGKGIKVCSRWQKFDNFYDDFYKAFFKHSERHSGDSQIDRIDSSIGYQPLNCRWLTGGENTARVQINRPSKDAFIRFRTTEEEKALIAEDAKLARFDDTSSYILFLVRLNRRKLRRD